MAFSSAQLMRSVQSRIIYSIVYGFDTLPACDRQMDGQTDILRHDANASRSKSHVAYVRTDA